MEEFEEFAPLLSNRALWLFWHEIFGFSSQKRNPKKNAFLRGKNTKLQCAQPYLNQHLNQS
jgi:hypothetical protein